MALLGLVNGMPSKLLVSDGSAQAQLLQTGPTQLLAVTAGNINAAARYVKFYDVATTPTSGLSCVGQMIIPGNTAGAGSNLPVGFANPMTGFQFVNGLGVAISTTNIIADTLVSFASAGDCTVWIGWK